MVATSSGFFLFRLLTTEKCFLYVAAGKSNERGWVAPDLYTNVKRTRAIARNIIVDSKKQSCLARAESTILVGPTKAVPNIKVTVLCSAPQQAKRWGARQRLIVTGGPAFQR
jgi:hypothetical protein